MSTSPLYERLYRSIYRARRVEEEIARIYPTDKIKSPVHLSIGQESVSVGVCDALRETDIAFGTYRGHALYLAKGGNINRMVAELYGKETGCGRGKSGSMHLIDLSVGMMGTSAIVASTIPQAIGYAFALQQQGSSSIVVCFFGDAATEEGVFSESLNYAALKELPILFVCENNNYAIFTPLSARQPKDSTLCGRVQSYGIPANRIEGGDILQIRESTEQAVALIRDGHGPQFMECMTYRWKEHVGPSDDWHLDYRSPDEILPWKENDQVTRLAEMLDGAIRQKIEAAVETEISEAFEFAEQSPFPPDEELSAHVFSS